MNSLKYIGIAAAVILFSGCATHEPNVQSGVIMEYLNDGSDQRVSQSEHTPTQKTSYEREREKMLTSMIKTPPTPMRVPDTVLRVMFLPYVDDEQTLTASNYKFTKVDNGKWIMGEHINKDGSPIRMLTPLTLQTIGMDVTASKGSQEEQPQEQNQKYGMVPSQHSQGERQ